MGCLPQCIRVDSIAFRNHFKSSYRSARSLAKEFANTFIPSQFVELDRYQIFIRLLENGVASTNSSKVFLSRAWIHCVAVQFISALIQAAALCRRLRASPKLKVRSPKSKPVRMTWKSEI